MTEGSTEAPELLSVQLPPAPKRMSRGGKVALWVVVAVVVLGMCGCSTAAVLLMPESAALGDSIALIHIDGAIAGTGSAYDGYMTPEALIDQLDSALSDDSVKAILLRIDSPGGTVAASQEISLAVRRASEVKPVVASIGDIGASGAYMVASQCDHIVASPGSLVGSIGVIMQIPNVEGLLDKVGVKFTVLTEGELKDVGSPYRSTTATETAMLQEQIGVAYEQFIADVAEGRAIPVDDVRELATGWVWMGTDALDLGLIDSLGNYSDAVDLAADLGGIEGEPGIVTYGPDDSFEALLFSLLGLRSPLGPVDAEALNRFGLPR
jgi:protease-4